MSHGKIVDHPVPPELADAEVVKDDGSSIRLGTYWADRSVVLAFVRHFG